MEAEFISWYTCSAERKTLVWKQIMHAWLIELHTLLWTHKDKGGKKRFRQFHMFFQSRPDSHLSNKTFFQVSTTNWAPETGSIFPKCRRYFQSHGPQTWRSGWWEAPKLPLVCNLRWAGDLSGVLVSFTYQDLDRCRVRLTAILMLTHLNLGYWGRKASFCCLRSQ